MRYVTSVERIAIKKGIQQGLRQGVQQGERRVLRRLLTRRFGALPAWRKAGYRKRPRSDCGRGANTCCRATAWNSCSSCKPRIERTE